MGVADLCGSAVKNEILLWTVMHLVRGSKYSLSRDIFVLFTVLSIIFDILIRGRQYDRKPFKEIGGWALKYRVGITNITYKDWGDI